MTLFEKCRAYLLKNNIELKDDDYSIDGRLQVDSNNNIIKWDFPLLKPSIEEINSKVDDTLLEQAEKRYRKKQKLKRIQNSFDNTSGYFNIPILDDNELLELIPYDGLVYINKKDESMYYYYNGKLNKVQI